jgi:hypothetical protein
MFGDKLTREECQNLLEDLSVCKNPFACAHGKNNLNDLQLFIYNVLWKGRPTVVPLALLPEYGTEDPPRMTYKNLLNNIK